MPFEAARQSLVAAVEAAASTLAGGKPVIEYDNRVLVDTATASAPFLRCNVVWFSGEQADLGPNPRQRLVGQLVLTCATKQGAGSAAALVMLGHLMTSLQSKQFGSVRIRMGRLTPAVPHLGWEYTPVILPFWVDVIT